MFPYVDCNGWHAGAELGGFQGGNDPLKFYLAPPVAPSIFFRSFSESPTQTINSSPCCKTGPSSGPPKWKCLAPPLVTCKMFSRVLLMSYKSPTFKVSAIFWQFSIFYQWPRIARDFYLIGGEDGSVARLWNLEVKASEYKKRFFDAWSEANLDAVICPPFPISSGPYKHFENTTGRYLYLVSGLWWVTQ